MKILLLSPLYLPPANYFRLMAESDLTVIDTSLPYNKRNKAVHRTAVSGRGEASLLTVPVSTPGTTRCAWDEVTVSPHGEWWRVHKLTLATLFGPTPYFDYFKDELLRPIGPDSVGRPVTDLDIDIILNVRKLLGIDTPLSVTLDSRYATDPGVEIIDRRHDDFYATGAERSIAEHLFHYGRL